MPPLEPGLLGVRVCVACVAVRNEVSGLLTPFPSRRAVAGRMSAALLEAVRGLHVADPDLGVKPLLAKLREQQPDLGAGTREVREALIAVKAAESEAAKAATVAAAGRVFALTHTHADVQPAHARARLHARFLQVHAQCATCSHPRRRCLL